VKKEVEVCDDCEEEVDALKICIYCKKLICEDCQEEHIEDNHFESFYDEFGDKCYDNP
jgi:hypothetical protein